MAESKGDRLVRTPAGKGRLTAISEVPGGWQVLVALSAGETWTGRADDLTGKQDQETIAAFRQALGEDREGDG